MIVEEFKVTYPLFLIPRLTLVPSEYTKDVDPIGNTTPVPVTVLTVIVYNEDVPLVVASSNTIILSAPSGIVTLLFAPNVPVSLMYRFLPFDVAPLSSAKAKSPEANCDEDK